MTEFDEIAQSIYDEAVRNPRMRWKLPSTRRAWFALVYEKMPHESYRVMDGVTDAIMALMEAHQIK